MAVNRYDYNKEHDKVEEVNDCKRSNDSNTKWPLAWETSVIQCLLLMLLLAEGLAYMAFSICPCWL